MSVVDQTVDKFYDQKAAQGRIQSTLMNFVDELVQKVYPNIVEVKRFSQGLEILIWLTKDPCFGEKYMLRYDGVNAQYQFQGYINREVEEDAN